MTFQVTFQSVRIKLKIVLRKIMMSIVLRNILRIVPKFEFQDCSRDRTEDCSKNYFVKTRRAYEHVYVVQSCDTTLVN